MFNKESLDLCNYRLSKAEEYLNDAKTTFNMGMYDTAANRSYYAIFHAVRALLALNGKDFRKHSGVISCFQQEYIKTNIFERRLSDILKSAFLLRQESDYDDFFIISIDEVKKQVKESEVFFCELKNYIQSQIGS